MIRLLNFLRPYGWLLLSLLALVIVQVAVNLQLPDYTAKIINEGVLTRNNGLIWQNGLLMLGISLIGGAATIGVGYFASKISAGAAMDMRNAVFEKVESFSLT